MNVDNTSNSMEVDTNIPSGSAHSSLSNAVKPYTYDDHRRMDEAVTHNMHHLYRLEGRDPRECLSFGDIFLVALLREVIRQDNRLDPKNVDEHVSIQLFDKHPSLRTMMADAWITGSYRDIRALGTHANHE